ncbi:hypothetical protein [Paraliomyxa miuraensis]|uniref:hypothetical protein n=1 Tax=Paraliomyxa miuraensis TaxID=376150 RepID=UPI002256E1A6|nr:hypothetical protein [Paraliomyxa miuraensis]MCX4244965.1 hypothetical protein [Paraliomyxa miuraensis]
MATSLLLTGALLAFKPPATAPAPVSPAGDVESASPEQLGRTRRPDKDLTFFGYFFTRAESTNVSPANDLFKGQVVGRLFGPNTTTTSDDRAVFLEQRFIPFFIYEPKILSKHARLRASFELDWTYGDVNNSTGGNFGSAFTADQVNLQTQNVQVEFDIPRLDGWYVDLGLQRLYDTTYDPYRTVFEQMQYTGTRLNFWGSDAVGLTVHGHSWGQKFKLGAYQLYENLIQEDDDVSLFELATDRHLGRTLHVGGHVRYLRDTSSGAGGVSVLGQGPSSALTEYNGVHRFPIPMEAERYRTHVAWTGVDASYNPLLAAGRLGASAYVVGNFGQISTSTAEAPTTFEQLAKIGGLAANARLAFRYGRTARDMIALEGTYTTGDANGITDGTYSGVITGNTWGAPGGLLSSSGTYLLMPHAFVVNRYYAAVTDLSNMGFGMTAGTLNASVDILPNQLELKLGTGVARSNIRPIAGDEFIGAELNGRLTWRFRPLVALEAHAAYLWLGDYFASPEIVAPEDDDYDFANATPQPVPGNPWTAFLTLRWLMI